MRWDSRLFIKSVVVFATRAMVVIVVDLFHFFAMAG